MTIYISFTTEESRKCAANVIQVNNLFDADLYYCIEKAKGDSLTIQVSIAETIGIKECVNTINTYLRDNEYKHHYISPYDIHLSQDNKVNQATFIIT